MAGEGFGVSEDKGLSGFALLLSGEVIEGFAGGFIDEVEGGVVEETVRADATEHGDKDVVSILFAL